MVIDTDERRREIDIYLLQSTMSNQLRHNCQSSKVEVVVLCLQLYDLDSFKIPPQPSLFLLFSCQFFHVNSSLFALWLLTLWFVDHVVLFAHELVLVDHIELLTGRDGLAAHTAGEAAQVEDSVPGAAHQIGGRNALITTGALWSEPPWQIEKRENN